MNNTEIDSKISDRFSFCVAQSLRYNESPQAMGCNRKSPQWGHPAFAIITRCGFPRGKPVLRPYRGPQDTLLFIRHAHEKGERTPLSVAPFQRRKRPGPRSAPGLFSAGYRQDKDTNKDERGKRNATGQPTPWIRQATVSPGGLIL